MARMPDRLPAVNVQPSVGPRMPAPDTSGMNDLTRALAGVAAEATQRAEVERNQADAVSRQQTLTRMRAGEAERLAREGDALSDDDAEGFADRFSQSFQAQRDQALAAVPERMREQVGADIEELGLGMHLRALDVERQRRDAAQGRQLDQTMQNAGSAVFFDATQYEESLAEARSAIENSRLSQGEKDRRLGEVEHYVAEQRILGLARAHPRAALSELNGGRWQNTFSPVEHAQYQDMAERELERRRIEAERAAREAALRMESSLRQSMEDDIASRAATGVGVNVDLGAIEAAYGQEARVRFERQRTLASNVYSQTASMASETPAQIRQRLEALRPAPGSAGFADAQEVFEHAQRGAQEVLVQRGVDPRMAGLGPPPDGAAARADPAGAALAANPQLAARFALIDDEGVSAAARAIIVRDLRAAQTALGVPPSAQRVMPQTMAVQFAQRITGASDAERGQTLSDTTRVLESLFAGDASQALAQVAAAGDLPELGALAPLTRSSDRARVARALTAPAARVEQGPRQRATLAVDRALAPLVRSLADTPGGPQRVAQARAAALATALHDVEAGTDPNQAGQNAGAMYASTYQFRDGWRAPLSWRGERLNLDRVNVGVLAIERDLGRGDDEATRARRDVVREARWVTRADDRGLLLFDPRTGRTVTDANGAPVSLDWDELQARGRRVDPFSGDVQ